ncbi:Lipid II isoglutaminyl synthase (glutamine-hydrolyzing) subunit GatD [Streptomyces hirsutus]
MFSVCAGYQILGHEFINDLGQREPGLGLVDVVSVRGEGARCVGDVLGDIDPPLGLPPLTGFENHQGVTHLGPTARPLARVRFGNGNARGTAPRAPTTTPCSARTCTVRCWPATRRSRTCC